MLALFIALIVLVAAVSGWAALRNLRLYRLGIRALRQRRSELHDRIVLHRLERSFRTGERTRSSGR